MRALVATGPGRLIMDEIADPEAYPGQVLVRSRVTAVSAGTELRMLYEGRAEYGPDPDWPAEGAFGYLAAGEVTAVGSGVTGVREGDRVACGRTWGAHREIIDTDATRVLQLPDDVSYLDGACAYWAVPPMCGILAGRPDFHDDVAVVGLGPLGLAAVQMLAPFCRTVIGIDPVAMRRKIAAGYGATVIDAAVDDLRATVRAVQPAGPNVVIQAAGSQRAFESCLQIVAPGGAVANVGTLPQLVDMDLFWPMQLSGARVVPIHRPGRSERQTDDGSLGTILRDRYLPDVIGMIQRGRLDIAGICTWCLPVAHAADALPLLRTRPDLCIGLAFAWDDADVKGVDDFTAARAALSPSEVS
jgi:alcohol dehydrogenase